jgi:hypothetical protein
MGHMPVQVAHCMQSLTLSPLSSFSLAIAGSDGVLAVISIVMIRSVYDPIDVSCQAAQDIGAQETAETSPPADTLLIGTVLAIRERRQPWCDTRTRAVYLPNQALFSTVFIDYEIAMLSDRQ